MVTWKPDATGAKPFEPEMQFTTEIRSETAADRQGIRELLTAAFNSSQEADLVDALRDDAAFAVSLTAGDRKSVV